MRFSFFTFLTSRLLPVAVGVLFTCAAAAQGLPGNGGTTGGPPAPGATTVPLDGGASLLLAGGVGLALRKLRRRRRA